MAITLKIKISEVAGVESYVFAYDEVSVTVKNGEGQFDYHGGTKTLRWWFVGNAGGSMRVQVLRGSKVVRERKKSQIPATLPNAYDWMDIAPEDVGGE